MTSIYLYITASNFIDDCYDNYMFRQIKFAMIMKWLIKMIDWFLRETWWRRYYKRITLDEKTTWGGRCLVCDAESPNNKNIRCDTIHNRDCPCKYNQCLKYK